MSLLDKASLIITPNAYKASKLYSVVPSSGAGDMTVVRATTATRVNSLGLIESVANNVPRIDYTNGSCPSLLVEPQRTNLLTYSNDFSNIVWIKNSATISTNSIISPDGSQNASKLVESNSNDSHHIYQNALSNGENTFTFFAKKGERKFVYAYADSVGQGKCFDLENGTLGVNIISSPLNATITSVGNNWYRCSITLVITIGTALRIGSCSANGTFSYLGNGTSGIFIWGAQLEQGSYPTSYIPTVATTITRNADVISKTGISSLIGQTDGTIFLDFNFVADNQTRRLLMLSDGTTDNRMLINTFINNVEFVGITSSTLQFNISTPSTLNNGRHKIACVYKNNSFILYVDGIQVAIDTSGLVALTSQFNIGNDISGSLIEKNNYNSIQLYKIALTDAECIALTTL